MLIDILERHRKHKRMPEPEGLTLARKMQFLAWGHPVDDVAAACVGMLMSCLVAKARDREHATEIARKTGVKMAEVIYRDYDSMLEDVGDDPKAN